jgi:hypothetical protein
MFVKSTSVAATSCGVLVLAINQQSARAGQTMQENTTTSFRDVGHGMPMRQ